MEFTRATSTVRRWLRERFSWRCHKFWTLSAIQKGGKIVFLMENNGGEFVMVAKKEIKDCKGIDGKRFAIHGDTSPVALAGKLWLTNECKIKPNVLIIPGGETNRRFAEQPNRPDNSAVRRLAQPGLPEAGAIPYP